MMMIMIEKRKLSSLVVIVEVVKLKILKTVRDLMKKSMEMIVIIIERRIIIIVIRDSLRKA